MIDIEADTEKMRKAGWLRRPELDGYAYKKYGVLVRKEVWELPDGRLHKRIWAIAPPNAPEYIGAVRETRLDGHYAMIVNGRPGAYDAVILDLSDCTAMGRTFAEVTVNATDAVAAWMQIARANGGIIPEPRSLKVLRSDPRVHELKKAGGVLMFVAPPGPAAVGPAP